MAETFLLKNILNENLVKIMARNLKSVSSDFDSQKFQKIIIPHLEPLALKERSKWISKQLQVCLPEDYLAALEILIESLQIPLLDKDGLGRYAEFYYMPFGEFVSQYGLEHFDESTHALKEITKVFTAEFDIRPFIERYPEQSISVLHDWVNDDNHRVRRLVSEGSRPRLPWAGRLPMFQKDPAPVLALLEKLKADPELYVRRSVANNLNDIAKDNPSRVMETLVRWNKSTNQGTQWIIRHATRTLIKDGHTEALLLLGFDPKAPVEISGFQISKTVVFGESLEFEFALKNTGNTTEKFVIDFVVYFKKANGKLAPKVFKLSEKSLKAGEQVSIKKSHPIKPISTRTYYAGIQKLAIQVNGSERVEAEFELVFVKGN